MSARIRPTDPLIGQFPLHLADFWLPHGADPPHELSRLEAIGGPSKPLEDLVPLFHVGRLRTRVGRHWQLQHFQVTTQLSAFCQDLDGVYYASGVCLVDMLIIRRASAMQGSLVTSARQNTR